MDMVLSVIRKDGVPVFTFPACDDNLFLISGVATAINTLTNQLGFGGVNLVETEKGIAIFKPFNNKLLVLFIRENIPKDFLNILFYFIVKELESFIDLIDTKTPIPVDTMKKFEMKFAKVLEKTQNILDAISKLNILYEKIKRVFGEESKEIFINECYFLDIENDHLKLNSEKIIKDDITIDAFIHLIKQCMRDVKHRVEEKTKMLS